MYLENRYFKSSGNVSLNQVNEKKNLIKLSRVLKVLQKQRNRNSGGKEGITREKTHRTEPEDRERAWSQREGVGRARCGRGRPGRQDELWNVHTRRALE